MDFGHTCTVNTKKTAIIWYCTILQ